MRLHPSRSVEFGIRPFATWTEAETAVPELTDHFPECSSLLSSIKLP